MNFQKMLMSDKEKASHIAKAFVKPNARYAYE